MTTKQRTQLLEEYFKASRMHFQIGNGELMQGRDYADKVRQLNFLFSEQRRIEKILKNI